MMRTGSRTLSRTRRVGRGKRSTSPVDSFVPVVVVPRSACTSRQYGGPEAKDVGGGSRFSRQDIG